jgi:hypothetical protein
MAFCDPALDGWPSSDGHQGSGKDMGSIGFMGSMEAIHVIGFIGSITGSSLSCSRRVAVTHRGVGA